jgi:hypothetical protein
VYLSLEVLYALSKGLNLAVCLNQINSMYNIPACRAMINGPVSNMLVKSDSSVFVLKSCVGKYGH